MYNLKGNIEWPEETTCFISEYTAQSLKCPFRYLRIPYHGLHQLHDLWWWGKVARLLEKQTIILWTARWTWWGEIKESVTIWKLLSFPRKFKVLSTNNCQNIQLQPRCETMTELDRGGIQQQTVQTDMLSISCIWKEDLEGHLLQLSASRTLFSGLR